MHLEVPIYILCIRLALHIAASLPRVTTLVLTAYCGTTLGEAPSIGFFFRYAPHQIPSVHFVTAGGRSGQLCAAFRLDTGFYPCSKLAQLALSPSGTTIHDYDHPVLGSLVFNGIQ